MTESNRLGGPWQRVVMAARADSAHRHLLDLLVKPGATASWARYRRLVAEASRFVLFVGYPRSGHSLLGSLVGSHPDALVAHELDVLAFLRRGYSGSQLLGLLASRDRAFTRAGRAWTGYTYQVEGQWSGRYRQLKVIGDKKGGKTTERLAEDPSLVERLQEVVGLPVHILHQSRNPFDNVATMALRAPSGGVNEAARRYVRLASTNDRLLSRYRDRALHTSLERLTQEPEEELIKVCRFLGLEAADDYLEACSSVIFDDARRTREDVAWTAEAHGVLQQAVATLDVLAEYRSP